MDILGDMRAFVTVVERGSFSGAAEVLKLTPSAVSKLVGRLEDRLGVRLVHRTTRRLSLTPEGETYHVRARDILATVADAENEVSDAGRRPRGRLRVNVGTAFALHELAPALPEFLARYPEVDVDLAVTDRMVDLLAEHADIAIRTGAVTDPSLVARKIRDMGRSIAAAPAYLTRRGAPARPEQLLHHDCIVMSSQSGAHRWPFRDGVEVRLADVRDRIVVDDAEAALQLALAGGGIVRLGDVLLGKPLREGALVALLGDWHLSETIPISAVYPQGRHRMPKVRAFVDFLVERLGRSAPAAQA